MQLRPDFPPQREAERPIYHNRAADPAEDPQGDLGALILRELLVLPSGVLDRPVFFKLRGHLENYRKHYVTR